MTKPAQWIAMEKITHTRLNGMVDDSISKTDANAQIIVSDLTIEGDLTVNGSSPAGSVEHGTVSGSSPITKAHSQGANIQRVQATPKAVQPYAFGVNWDNNNIYIYHSGMGSVTFSYDIYTA